MKRATSRARDAVARGRRADVRRKRGSPIGGRALSQALPPASQGELRGDRAGQPGCAPRLGITGRAAALSLRPRPFCARSCSGCWTRSLQPAAPSDSLGGYRASGWSRVCTMRAEPICRSSCARSCATTRCRWFSFKPSSTRTSISVLLGSARSRARSGRASSVLLRRQGGLGPKGERRIDLGPGHMLAAHAGGISVINLRTDREGILLAGPPSAQGRCGAARADCPACSEAPTPAGSWSAWPRR